jgi:hypothetical protein
LPQNVPQEPPPGMGNGGQHRWVELQLLPLLPHWHVGVPLELSHHSPGLQQVLPHWTPPPGVAQAGVVQSCISPPSRGQNMQHARHALE